MSYIERSNEDNCITMEDVKKFSNKLSVGDVISAVVEKKHTIGRSPYVEKVTKLISAKIIKKYPHLVETDQGIFTWNEFTVGYYKANKLAELVPQKATENGGKSTYSESKTEEVETVEESSRNTLLPLFIETILKDNTNPQNTFSSEDIIKRLDGYPYSIHCDRKTVARHVESLSLAFPYIRKDINGKSYFDQKAA